MPFLTALSIFLLFAFGSILFSLDPARSIVAFADLLIVAFLAYCISIQILSEPEQEKLIVRSVSFGLAIYVLFCIAEYIAWTQGITINVQKGGSWLESTFGPSTLWNFVPILSGTTFDANRSGFVLMIYLALLDKFAAKWRYTPIFRALISILIFVTLSRSATLCWLAYHLCSQLFWQQLLTRRVIVRTASVLIAGSILCVAYQREILEVLEIWEISDAVTAKLSMDPGSSGESHILLIERGLKTWLTSTKTVIAGIGFAAAPKVLDDFFQNDKHGNFHSLYVTALAEMGLPAFFVLMFILGYPAIGRAGNLPCIAAIMVFNVSYQTHMEPVFWLILALLWSSRKESRLLTLRNASAADFPTHPSAKAVGEEIG